MGNNSENGLVPDGSELSEQMIASPGVATSIISERENPVLQNTGIQTSLIENGSEIKSILNIGLMKGTESVSKNRIEML